MSYSRVIREGLYTAPTFNLGGDCIQVWGSDGGTLIQDCIFDLSAVPLADQDEAIDCIKGAHVVIDRCVFIGCKKAILGGNGDYPAEDKSGLLFLKNCAFIRCGRRCPEVQDGVMSSSLSIHLRMGMAEREDYGSHSFSRSGSPFLPGCRLRHWCMRIRKSIPGCFRFRITLGSPLFLLNSCCG